MINGRPVVVEEKRSTSRGELDFEVNIFRCHWSNGIGICERDGRMSLMVVYIFIDTVRFIGHITVRFRKMGSMNHFVHTIVLFQLFTGFMAAEEKWLFNFLLGC